MKYIFATLLSTLLFSTLVATDQAHANFNAGRILDDTVMTDHASMNVDSIQNFFNSKVTCDTWGTKQSEYGGGTRAQYAASRGWQSPPYYCMNTYKENGISAAQIVYDKAQKYHINPKVLIVLLQKEQGLITDEWPLYNPQYKTATGYGCPDTAPCDSQYFGLANQLDWAAKMFRSIMDNSPNWYTPYILGNNFIQYSPNSSCGGSTVNIENRATQALYNYTPYQPNKAALDAGWGSVPCGAYGNRNFYLYYTSWFGSTAKPALPNCTTTELNCVYGFVNETTGKMFYTSDTTERNQVYSGNYSFKNIAFHSRKTGTNALPVSRLYNGSENYHLWTSNSQEIASLTASGVWSNEGIKFYMDPLEANTGVYVKRLYTTQSGGRHVLSSNAKEISDLKSSGYTDEGPVFKTSSLVAKTPLPIPGKINVYRFFFGNRHFWTQSVSERDHLVKTGLKYEGVSWQTPVNGTMPVYRVYSPTGYHFWTTSQNEKNILVKNGWKYEGISWNALGSGSPTYRLYNTKSGVHLFTTSAPERTSLISTGYWRDEGISWHQ